MYCVIFDFRGGGVFNSSMKGLLLLRMGGTWPVPTVHQPPPNVEPHSDPCWKDRSCCSIFSGVGAIGGGEGSMSTKGSSCCGLWVRLEGLGFPRPFRKGHIDKRCIQSPKNMDPFSTA